MPQDTAQYAWRIEAGEREVLTFPILDGSDDLFPIDGWEVTATIRTRPGGLLLYTFPAEHATVDIDDNTVSLLIPGPVSALWVWTAGWFSVQLTNPVSGDTDPDTSRVLSGPFVVDPA